MATANVRVRIELPADEVWEVVGDLGSIADWLPMLASSKLEGDHRVCELEGGGTIVEPIVQYDDVARTYQYTLTEGPLEVDDYLATVEVLEEGDDACVVSWTIQVTPDELAGAIQPSFQEGLQSLKEKLEA